MLPAYFDFMMKEVHSMQGEWTGKVYEGGTAYLGIPYALPPVGERRFCKPVEVDAIPGVYNKFGPAAPQWGGDEPMSEDCLYLNLYVPDGAKKAPVLFWIHGGASMVGSGARPEYDGRALSREGIIVVTFNHRLGALGFLAHPSLSAETKEGVSGNWGVWDIVAAWNWVRRNISIFGGDPDRITMGGQSAGAGATEYLMTYPPVAEHMAGAALMSTTPYEYRGIPRSVAHYEAMGKEYMDLLGASSAKELRSIPAMKWIYRSDMMRRGGFSFAWDNELFSEGLQEAFFAGHYPKVPMLIGSTFEERCFRLDDDYGLEAYHAEVQRRFGEDAEAFLRFYDPKDDAQAIRCRSEGLAGDRPHAAVRFTARMAARWQKSIYVYRFAQEPPHPANVYGSDHSDDVPYWFGALDRIDRPWTAKDREVSSFMVRALANFVRSGDPNGSGARIWPDFAEREASCLIGPRDCCDAFRIEENPVPEKWYIQDRHSAYSHLLET